MRPVLLTHMPVRMGEIQIPRGSSKFRFHGCKLALTEKHTTMKGEILFDQYEIYAVTHQFISNLSKQLLFVIPHLRNALENIIAGQMHLPLRWNLRQQLIAAPTPRHLFDSTHIDDPVM